MKKGGKKILVIFFNLSSICNLQGKIKQRSIKLNKLELPIRQTGKEKKKKKKNGWIFTAHSARDIEILNKVSKQKKY